jgi:hypothetical protein
MVDIICKMKCEFAGGKGTTKRAEGSVLEIFRLSYEKYAYHQPPICQKHCPSLHQGFSFREQLGSYKRIITDLCQLALKQ